MVLLVACANVAGLLLARGAARQQEIATRIAIGAGRFRVIRQLLTESLTLALAGGAAGLVTGVWLTGWLQRLLPATFLFLSFDVDFGLDWRVFGFMLVVVMATFLVCGLAPALQVSRPEAGGPLKSARLSGSRRAGLRAALVVAQVALSIVLLVAAVLCARTLRNAAAIDVGYETAHVLTARIDLAKQRYMRIAAVSSRPSSSSVSRPRLASRPRLRGHAAAQRRSMGESRPPRRRPNAVPDVSRTSCPALLSR